MIFSVQRHWERRPDDSFRTALIHCLPLRLASRVWGWANQLTLPVFARAPIYQAWTSAFGCNLDEMRYPLEHYENLAAFFSRPLKDGARPIDETTEMVSPVDAVVTQFGSVSPAGTLEQIKGSSFALSEFLGRAPPPSIAPGNQLYFCVLYLAPGDYHRVHSSVDWSVDRRHHVPGQLLSVAPDFLRRVPNVLASNERIVLSGSWARGFFSLTSVGAQNVGSIKLVHEPHVVTNAGLAPVAEPYGSGMGGYDREIVPALPLRRGDEVARFELGSTVVLVFEGPADFGFAPSAGARIRVGEPLGACGRGWPSAVPAPKRGAAKAARKAPTAVAQ